MVHSNDGCRDRCARILHRAVTCSDRVSAPGTAPSGGHDALHGPYAISLRRGTNWDHVGTTLHAFLAADYPELGNTDRTELARRILADAGLDVSFTTDALLGAGDALRKFVTDRWPQAIWHREVPVLAALDTEHGSRRIAGSIDLLLETPTGFVIIDHKSFPGAASNWEPRALEYAPQLMTYSKAIEMAGGTVIGRFVHFTVGGGMAELVDA